MSAATIGALKVVLGLDSAQFETGLTAAQKHLRGVGQSMQKLGQGFAMVGAGLTATITAPLIAAGFAASRAATEAADAMGQVEAALTSMGAASGKTQEQLAGLAEGLMRNSLYDDDDILRKVTANLLTFGRVAGQNFDRAQQAAVDLATRMQMDLQPATLLIGKALNDPVKGLTAMGRAGIQFTAAQKDMIKSMVAGGNVAGAQTIILNELENQFGGAAAAAQKTDPYDKLRDSLNTLSESMGVIVNRYLTPLMDGVAGLADRFNTLSPTMQNFVVIGAGIAAALGPALIAIGAVVGAVGTLITTLGTGGALAGVGVAIGGIVPFILPVAAAVAAVVGAFLLFRDDVEPVLKRLWATAQETLGPALGELFATVGDLVRGLAGAWMKFFDGPIGQAISKFAALVVDLLGNSVVRTLTALVVVVEGTLSNIGSLFSILGDLLTGDFAGAWATLKGAVTNTLQMIGGVIEAFWPGAVDSMRKLYEGVKSWLQDKLGGVFTFVGRKVKEAGDAFFNLYDRVVGHSYVPDMVVEVGQWMAKLQETLVNPAERTTRNAADKFQELRDRVRGIMDGLLTDQERAFNRFRDENASLEAAAATGKFDPAMISEFRRRNQARYDEERTERLDPMQRVELRPLTAIDDLREAMGVDRIKERIADMRNDFADAFANGLDAALRGDWTSVLQSMFGDAVRDTMRNVGSQIFDLLGLGNSGMKSGGGFGNIASIVSSMFSKLPKFSGGGTILPAGVGNGDTRLNAFWTRPDERIDISKPGQSIGQTRVVVEVNDDRFNAYVDDRAEPIARAAESRAVRTSTDIGRRGAPALQQRLRKLGTA
ncbi:MAG: hypothetical protein EON89_00870 [Brevundimonas sp.]|nr:MAG: hypothetical protein EON89_00870 [Brevundimonas sp.]